MAASEAHFCDRCCNMGHFLCSRVVRAGPLPAWDTRGGEEFSERGPNFLNYVQHTFPGGQKFSIGG